MLLNGAAPSGASERQLRSAVFGLGGSQSTADLNSQFQLLNGALTQV